MPGGRPRKWGSEAERKAAERKRALESEGSDTVMAKSGIAPRSEPDEIDVQIARAIREAEAMHQRLPIKTPPMSEDEYVKWDLDASLTGDRKSRAERYLRWRYRGYCAGVVASL